MTVLVGYASTSTVEQEAGPVRDGDVWIVTKPDRLARSVAGRVFIAF